MRPLLLLALGGALFACSSPDVCAHVSGTCVVAHVEGSGSIRSIDQLQLAGSGAFTAATHTTPSAPKLQALPLDVGVTFPVGVSGNERIDGIGLLGGRVTSRGSASVSVVAGQHTRTTLTLMPTTADVDLGMGGGDMNGVDGAAPDLNGVFNVSITNPSATIYTNGTVNVQLLVENGVPDSVQLLLDNAPLASLSAPYQYAWDTTSQPEGMHTLVARASRGGMSTDSPARTVYVDRTPPTVMARVPQPTATNVEMLAPITATFSEPLKPATVNDGSVTVQSGTANIAKTLALSADGKTLTITPDWTQVTLPATPLITFTTQITDLAGNGLTLPGSPWTWSIPIWQSIGTIPSDNIVARMTTDSAGNHPTIVFKTGDIAAGPNHVFELINGTWVEHANLNSVANCSDCRYADVAWTSTGTLLAGFEGDSVNWVASWDGSKWSFVTKQMPAAGPFPTDFAVDGSDAPMFAYYTPTGVELQRYDGQKWSALGTDIPRNGGANSFVVVRKDGTGAPVVGFPDFVSTTDKNYQVTFYRWDGSKLGSIGGIPGFSTSGVTSLSLEYGPGNVGCFTEQQSGYGYKVGSIVNGSASPVFTDLPQQTITGTASRHGQLVRLKTPSSGPQTVIVSYEASGGNSWTDYPTINSTGVGIAVAVDALNRPIVAYTPSGGTGFVMVRASMPLP